jgi:glycosyltransferase involved in cell wall biosynthesis
MHVGIVSTRLAGVDGVTFEATKWEMALERMGHEVRMCSGAVDALRTSARLVPPMHFAWPPAARVTEAAFDPESDPQAVRAEVERLADLLVPVLDHWMMAEHIEVLVVENAWAIPMHLPLGLALRRIVERNGMLAIGHHHDYWWERQRFAQCVVPELLDEAFPPDLPTVEHVSINSLAATQLRMRRGLESMVVPNVFDFERPRPRPHPAVRRRMREELGMNERGLLVVQPTRVVPRKGIELAIELVARLKDPKAVLLITSPAGDEGLDYLVQLERLAEQSEVNLRYAADRFEPDLEGKPVGPAHTLHDAYLAADLITYPSLYEGYGNALIEAIFYGKPVVVNRYPVYVADIASLGLEFIEIDGGITDATVASVHRALGDKDYQARVAARNYEIAVRRLSYKVLRRRLRRLLGEVVGGVTGD